MTRKPDALDDDLDLGAIARPPPPKRRFAALEAGDDDPPDTAPAAAAPAGPGPRRTPGVEAAPSYDRLPSLLPGGGLALPAPQVTLKTSIPDYLGQALDTEAARLGVSKRYVLLKALERAGYAIRAEDLFEDGRRFRGVRALTRT